MLHISLTKVYIHGFYWDLRYIRMNNAAYFPYLQRRTSEFYWDLSYMNEYFFKYPLQYKLYIHGFNRDLRYMNEYFFKFHRQYLYPSILSGPYIHEYFFKFSLRVEVEGGRGVQGLILNFL